MDLANRAAPRTRFRLYLRSFASRPDRPHRSPRPPSTGCPEPTLEPLRRASDPTPSAPSAGCASAEAVERAEALGRLAARASQGDGSAWERLVSELGPDVLSLARRAGLGADDADEVYQDTFFALYRRLDQLERPEALHAWVRVTAQRISWRVRRKRERHQPLTEAPEPIEERSPEALIQAVEGRQHLAEALARLPERCRLLLELLYLEPDPLSYEDIGKRLNIPVGSIGPTRARCLLRLAMQLNRESQDGLDLAPTEPLG